MKPWMTIVIAYCARIACAADGQLLLSPDAPRVSTAAAAEVVQSTSAFAVPRTNEQKLSDPDPIVRRNAVILIGAARRPASFPAIAALLADPSVDVRRAAVNAAAQTDPPRAAKAIIDRYAVEDSMAVKLSIISVLGELKSPAGVPLLRAALSEPYPQFRSEAVRALAAVNAPESRGAVLLSLGDEAEAVRIAAADAAGRARLEDAIPLLEKNLADPAVLVRRAATLALTAIGGPASLAALKKVQNDPDMSVRKPALEGIRLLTPAASSSSIMETHE